MLKPSCSFTLQVLLSCAVFSGIVLGEARTAKADPSLDSEQRAITREIEELQLRTRLLEERLRLLKLKRAREERSSGRAPKQPVSYDSCETPFFVDMSGVKHLRPECASAWSVTSCALPFEIQNDGIKRVRLECRVEMTAPERPGRSE